MIRFLKLFSLACGGLLCCALLAIWYLPEKSLSGMDGDRALPLKSRGGTRSIGMPQPVNSDYRPQEYDNDALQFDGPGLFAMLSMQPEPQLFPQPEQLDTELPYSRRFFLDGNRYSGWPGGFSGGGILAGASGGGGSSRGTGITAASRGGAGSNGGRPLLAAADPAMVTPVPLPIGLVFFATALMVLGLVTRRQRIPG